MLYSLKYGQKHKEVKNVKEYECKKCGHKWFPRKKTKPYVCPSCHLYTWDEDKKVK